MYGSHWLHAELLDKEKRTQGYCVSLTVSSDRGVLEHKRSMASTDMAITETREFFAGATAEPQWRSWEQRQQHSVKQSAQIVLL